MSITVNLTGSEGAVVGKVTLKDEVAHIVGAAALDGICPVLAPVISPEGKMYEAELVSGHPAKPANNTGAVTTLAQLFGLAQCRRSVKTIMGVMPAAVVMNMQGCVILRLMTRGMYVYTPKTKREDWYKKEEE